MNNINKDKFEEIRAELGHPPMLRASTFDKIRRNKTTTSKPKGINVQYHTDGWTKTECWSSYINVEDMMELEGLYVDLNVSTVMYKDKKVEKFESLLQSAERWGFIDEDVEIYGLRARNQKREHELVNFFDFIEQKLKESKNYHFFDREIFQDQLGKDDSLRRRILKELPKSSDMYKISKAIDDNINNKFHQKDQDILNKIGINVKGEKMSALITKVHQKYGMIKGSFYRCTNEQIIDYCKQMDKLEKLEAD